MLFILTQSPHIHLVTKVESQANRVNNLVPAQLCAIILASINTEEACMEIST